MTWITSWVIVQSMRHFLHFDSLHFFFFNRYASPWFATLKMRKRIPSVLRLVEAVVVTVSASDGSEVDAAN